MDMEEETWGERFDREFENITVSKYSHHDSRCGQFFTGVRDDYFAWYHKLVREWAFRFIEIEKIKAFEEGYNKALKDTHAGND